MESPGAWEYTVDASNKLYMLMTLLYFPHMIHNITIDCITIKTPVRIHEKPSQPNVNVM